MRGRKAIRGQRGIHRPFLIFFTLPALIAAGLLALGALSVWLDVVLDRNGWHALSLAPPAGTAITFHAAVATGAITALSLAYSLTLIVFTLAAGNVGPRLLQRFTSELTIQLTAGIFGGTFLFALNALFATHDEFVPEVTTMLTALLALICVVQLIYFVRHVAANVTIDDEISAIGHTLAGEMEEILDRGALPPPRMPDAPRCRLLAPEDGYLTQLDIARLIAIATERDLTLRFSVGIGAFVLAGGTLLEVEGQSRLTDETAEAMLKAITLSSSRSQAQSVDFSIRLLIEIALRGLSPGVNDTFTAIACLNRLASALRRPLALMSDGRHLAGPGGQVRLIVPGTSVGELVELAFTPLRDAMGSNLLFATHLARALCQLDEIADPRARPHLEEQATLLLKRAGMSDFMSEDREAIREALGALGQRVGPGAKGRGDEQQADRADPCEVDPNTDPQA
ncbi:hypothetical protein BV394_07200 [Brevirhabdus pacifica]|uniref:Uncharacterized protein n=1 Tax=Brevirhabdus pacifica TaxID=1267768 RepID=A0A1U7DHR7_9RHOB|nr:DUF2254 domain-containing protein [Brevirhabdus pacifica]APX89526.1 hypothetical protein BV394_07200 [Brevirhabdus pacifica]OWU76468.1 hypothetical protein ATO5_09100 [Loktanella sp. 22II-4b]PJJ85817.1 putative membrane protein [Brevirhabdus pacifica]